MMLAVRTVEDIDKELMYLRGRAADTLRGGEQWNVIWERIDQLLEERREIREVS